MTKVFYNKEQGKFLTESQAQNKGAKIKIANGIIIEIKVSAEQAEVMVDLNRKLESHERKFKRRTLKETSLEYLKDEYEWEPTDESTDVQGEVEREYDAERVRQAVACLNSKQREIVRLYFYEGKTEREIAEIFGVDGAGIHRQISTIKKALKKLL